MLILLVALPLVSALILGALGWRWYTATARGAAHCLDSARVAVALAQRREPSPPVRVVRPVLARLRIVRAGDAA